MKKTFGTLFAIFFATFIFASCDGIIFDEVRNEVKLEDAQISGDINSIVRFENYLYIQNGAIWRKEASAGAHNWSKVAKPSTSAKISYVNKLAADSTTLYAQVSLVNEDKDDNEMKSSGTQIFYSDDEGSSWKGPVSFDGKTTFAVLQSKIFCTNDVIKENRRAYFMYVDVTEGWKFVELRASESLACTKITKEDNDSTEEPTKSTESCAFFNGEVYFSNATCMVTNAAPAKIATVLYKAYGSTLYWSFASDEEKLWNAKSMNNSIFSLAVTKDYLIFGTSKGIEHIPFSTAEGDPEGTPGATTVSFNNNASSTLSSNYEIRCVLVVNPALNEADSFIYGTTVFSGSSSSTSATQENSGLWSYYPSRGKWNRE